MILYHGTTKESAEKILKNGWEPSSYFSKGNQGDSNLLYLTNEIDNARWFSEQNGGDVVLAVEIDEDKLIVDSQDGIGENVMDEIKRSQKIKMPAYLATKYPIPAHCFKII